MATGGAATPPFRLVTCPKCRLLLPELPNLPVYRCGGCGALLQAKNQKKDAKAKESVDFNESLHISGNKEATATIFHHEANPSSHSSPDCNNGEDQNGYGACKGAMDFPSNGNHNDGGSHFGSGDYHLEGPAVDSEVYSSTELLPDETLAGQPSPQVRAVDDSPPPFAGSKSSEEEDQEEPKNEHPTSGTPNLLAQGRGSLAVAADVPFSESTLLACSPPDQSRKTDLQGFGSMRSRDTSGATDYASPSSEFSAMFVDESKSPTARGSRAYDGSISSYEGLEDQFSDRYLHSLKNTRHHKADNSDVTKEKLRRDQFLVDSMRSIDSEIQYQPSKWLPESLAQKKRYGMKQKRWDHDEQGEPTRNLRPPRNSVRVERNDLPPKVPLYRRSFQAGYGGGSFSSQAHQDYQWDSGFHSSGKLEYQQQEKMKLLRMIRELQDQLDKSCNLEGKANGRVSAGVGTWKENNTATCYNCEVPMEETWHDQLEYDPMHRLGSKSAQQSRFPRMSFSGEAPNSRHHIERQCFHCHPHEWKRSAPLPPVHCHKGLHSVHPGYDCCNTQSSCQSSPQRYMEPADQFSIWSHETKSGDQRLKDHVMRKYLREKHVVAKKHLRPKEGGAPFITCYLCSQLLQLPEDFLLFKRRYHKLRCGACSRILKFSVQNRTHIIPYSPDADHLDPPPSEADECSGVIDRRSAASYRGCNCPYVGPVSYSDDYGISVCKSCSTEGDPVPLAQVHALRDSSSRDRKMSHASSFASMEKKKEVMRKQFRNKYKDPVEEHGSARPSSSMSKAEKFSSEIEVQQQQRSTSPLHRLMGYSSPSIVIRGTGMPAAGTSS